MAEDIITLGMRIEITDENVTDEERDSKPIYISQVENLFSNGDFEIDMPIYQRQLVLLHNGARYKFLFYGEKHNYEAVVVIKDRYKADNQYLLRVQLITQPEKVQRREYYRCCTTFEVKFHDIAEAEVNASNFDLLMEQYNGFNLEKLMLHGLVVDISGGGMKMISRFPNEPGSYKRLVFSLPIEGKTETFSVCGQILSCELRKDTISRYENRLKFVKLGQNSREKFIRFIFEEERKIRSITRGNDE
ncbi:MAG: flagellar brake protein [Lachnospiraceae bacterium]|nr:flagellar brake protein [Lachnospiraceae bacterium]